MYILDTNVLRAVFNQRGLQPHLEARLKQTPYEHLFISIVSVEEVFRGTLELFRRYEKAHQLTSAYAFIDGLLMDLQEFQILSFQPDADAIYKGMSAAARRCGRGDCRIAASAIASGYKVITRNEADFRTIGADFENWFVA